MAVTEGTLVKGDHRHVDRAEGASRDGEGCLLPTRVSASGLRGAGEGAVSLEPRRVAAAWLPCRICGLLWWPVSTVTYNKAGRELHLGSAFC